MKILVVNAGSSSLKYQLVDMADESVIAKGLCERIGIAGSKLVYKPGKEKHEFQKDMKDHTDAIRMVLDALVDPEIGVLKSMDEIAAVGHRVVHGGEKF
ncbi:MAG: acetate kinase, partial [Clostridia bacterium]|nr:acetate kinase [Clostridia bacterium]